MFLVNWHHWSDSYTWHKTCETHCFKTRAAATTWMDAKIGAALKENPELVVTDTGPGYKMLDNPGSPVYPSWYYQFELIEVELDFTQDYVGMLTSMDYPDDV